jgi:hypothetical protein
MRTVLLSSVAALALTFATGSLSPAHAQAAAPSPSDTTAPDQSAPPDQSAASDPSAPAAATPVKHHHRLRHANEASADSAGSDHWAHQPGTGESGPASTRASNIDAADTHSDIAPHLPEPAVGAGAGPDKLLEAAQAAIAAHHTGTAQQALEMAETRLLDRSTPVGSANQPDDNQRVEAVASARKALASGDTHGAEKAIQTAMAGGGEGMGQGGGNGASPGAQVPVQSTPGPQ